MTEILPYVMKTKDEILRLWLDWVEDSASWTEEGGAMSCFFCGAEYIITTRYERLVHKSDCIYGLTKQYIEQKTPLTQ
jgi:hypothetical protein